MTRITNVHTREIAAPAAMVGEILGTLGSEHDRLWASDIWLAEPVVFDRPLGVGAVGGHGRSATRSSSTGPDGGSCSSSRPEAACPGATASSLSRWVRTGAG